MADLDFLADPVKTALTIKLDGYIEACVALARLHNIGLGEALSLTALALMRELQAHGIQRERARQIAGEAIDRLWPSQAAMVLTLN